MTAHDSTSACTLGTYVDRMMSTIPGWLYEPDISVIRAVDAVQREHAVDGDLLEIGVYHGRSAILLGFLRRGDERVVLCDLFDAPANSLLNRSEMVKYDELYAAERPPSLQNFRNRWNTVHQIAPLVLAAPSSELDGWYPPERGLRMAHVDGSHVYDEVLADADFVRRHLVPGGICVFDDYRETHTLGVAAAVWQLAGTKGFVPLCATDHKLYGTWGDPTGIRDRLWAALSVFPGYATDYINVGAYKVLVLMDRDRFSPMRERSMLERLLRGGRALSAGVLGSVRPARPVPAEGARPGAPAHASLSNVGESSRVTSRGGDPEPVGRERRAHYSTHWYEEIQTGSSWSAEGIVPFICELVRPKSVVDIGCGTGDWLAAFVRRGVPDILGVDGEHIPRANLQIAPEQFVPWDLEIPFSATRTFDLAVSVEVGEHLSSDVAERYVQSLTELAPVVLFSAAIPGQQGELHINEQWPQYWADHFAERAYHAVDCIRSRFWDRDEIDWWYRQNAVLYVRDDVVETVRQRLRDLGNVDAADSVDDHVTSLVHPELWLVSRERPPTLGEIVRAIPGAAARSVSHRAQQVCGGRNRSDRSR
jgi:SAM-dependent methyltransferase